MSEHVLRQPQLLAGPGARSETNFIPVGRNWADKCRRPGAGTDAVATVGGGSVTPDNGVPVAEMVAGALGGSGIGLGGGSLRTEEGTSGRGSYRATSSSTWCLLLPEAAANSSC
jgi:hypothetical protein